MCPRYLSQLELPSILAAPASSLLSIGGFALLPQVRRGIQDSELKLPHNILEGMKPSWRAFRNYRGGYHRTRRRYGISPLTPVKIAKFGDVIGYFVG